MSAIDQTFRQAAAAFQAGDAANAERWFKETLRRQPGHVAALNLYGILLTRMGRFADAERYLKRALKENATSYATFQNYGVVLKALNRPEEALEQFTQAIAIDQSVADCWNSRADINVELKRYQEAIDDCDRAIALNPQLVDALVNAARALVGLEQYEEALDLTDQALAIQPKLALAWLCRGNIYNHLVRFDDALAAFARAVTLKTDLAEAWIGRGNTYFWLERDNDALTAFEKALALKPDSAAAWAARGGALCSMFRYDEAAASFERALELKPDLARAWHGRGDVLAELRRDDEAFAAFEKSLTLQPDLADAHNSLGNLLTQHGRVDEARAAFQKAIQIKPAAAAPIYFNFVDTKKFKPDDPDLAAMEALAANPTRLSKRDRKFLDFALGKAYADIGDFRRSFQHVLAANAAERSIINYDEIAKIAFFDQIEKTFTHELIAAKSASGELSSRPIFVVGMPRSGSTLVEQVLASHPAIEGAGELAAFGGAINASGSQAPYPDLVLRLDASAIRSIGQSYMDHLTSIAPQSERIIDKGLGNFFYAGLIHLALPNAVIIHTVRDPVDTCVSCFALRFRAPHPYAYDLAELGRYYMRYRHLMEHWRRTLPPGRILDVQYENVVADLEGQARRNLAHCGLPWDDRCLAFHKTDRPVRTASLNQVRQPIYKSSVGRWRAYAEFLAPLLQELGIAASVET